MLKKLLYLHLILTPLSFFSCSSDENTNSDDIIEDGESSTEEDNDNQETTSTYLISESLLNSDSLISFEIVDAKLENGTTAECYQIVFSGNPDNINSGKGPFCPETNEAVAGLSFYDGATNPGLRVWNSKFLTDLTTDGYDFVDEDGTVHVNHFDGATDGDPDTYSYCLDGADQNVEITFLIPVTPILANEVNEITEVELAGMSLDGIPINGQPPSAIWGPYQNIVDDAPEPTVVNIPSLDPCGGHNDPRGYYHWHLIPEVANKVLVANNITEVECTNVEQTTDKVLSGFAKDGFPIYAYATEPEGLDECGGIEAATEEYPDGVYHYVASTTVAPNVPPCLVGVTVSDRDAYVIN